MPHERQAADHPLEWLNRAYSDLAIASAQIADAYPEDLCYHAQQATEKALKALLLHRVVAIPRVHDISDLLGNLLKTGVTIPESIREAAFLSEYAVAARYPGLEEPVTPDELQSAIEKAREVVLWVESIVLPT